MLPEGWKGTGVTLESGQAHVLQVRRVASDDGLYALKRLKNPDRAERFAREAATMKVLHESGVAVPRIVAADFEADRPWFAMPWFVDGSLEGAREDGRFVEAPVKGVQMLLLLASTLADVHANGVAHRDLKPANVLLDGDVLALTDFGLCLDLPGDGADADRLTETAEAIGSRYYIAPENEGGVNEEPDQRPADFYAFGKVAWVLLSGRRPLPREQQLEDRHLIARVLGDPRLEALDTLSRELLNRDPRARLADWEAVSDDLRAIESALGGRGRGEPRPVRSDVLRAARRVRTAGPLASELEDHVRRQRREGWHRALSGQLAPHAASVLPALEPLQAELADLLRFTASAGAPVGAHTIVAAGLPALPGSPMDPSDMAAAVVFSIHATRGLSCLPSIAIRVWPVVHEDRVWFVSVPTITRADEAEGIATFLRTPLHRVVGPFPAYRQSTVQEGLALVESIGRLFVALAEQYVLALGAGEELGEPATWAERPIVEVELSERRHDAGGEVDTAAPELVDFDLSCTAEQTITVSCRIRDERSGINHGNGRSPSQVALRSRSDQTRWVIFTPGTRLSGDDHDGTYASTIELGPHAERGFWRVVHLSLVDEAGNERSYDERTLEAEGFPGSVFVR